MIAAALTSPYLIPAVSGRAYFTIPDEHIVWSGKGSDLAGAIARHPMHKLGGFFAKPRPFIAAEHVTPDAGTGLVHMAPDQGEEDFIACTKIGLEPVFAVKDDWPSRRDWLRPGRHGAGINPK